MAVKVTTHEYVDLTFDSADSWTVDASNLLTVGSDTQVSAMFAPSVWAFVELVPATTTEK
jgi:hypothetical protein